MWKVGVIGAGYWSAKHFYAWNNIDNVQINGVCDRNTDLLQDKSKQYNLSNEICYTDVESMLKNADIDIVDIITPPETHLDLVRMAAAAGKHIMCQKPFARSVEEAEQIIGIAKDAGVRLMVTENWRWLEPFQELKKLLDQKVVGDIKTVRYIHTDFYTPRFGQRKPLPQPFFRDMPNLLFYEMGVHWFDTWRFLFGEPKRLYAEIANISPYIKGEDTGFITFGHDTFIGLMDMSWATRRELDKEVDNPVLPNHQEQLYIEGDKATLKLYKSGRITIVDNNGKEKTIIEDTSINYEQSHLKLQSNFINCLDNGNEFQTSGLDNLKTLKLVFGAYESAKKHQSILFE